MDVGRDDGEMILLDAPEEPDAFEPKDAKEVVARHKAEAQIAAQAFAKKFALMRQKFDDVEKAKKDMDAKEIAATAAGTAKEKATQDLVQAKTSFTKEQGELSSARHAFEAAEAEQKTLQTALTDVKRKFSALKADAEGAARCLKELLQAAKSSLAVPPVPAVPSQGTTMRAPAPAPAAAAAAAAMTGATATAAKPPTPPTAAAAPPP
jgi:chromosome segregation ATPase